MVKSWKGIWYLFLSVNILFRKLIVEIFVNFIMKKEYENLEYKK